MRVRKSPNPPPPTRPATKGSRRVATKFEWESPWETPSYNSTVPPPKKNPPPPVASSSSSSTKATPAPNATPARQEKKGGGQARRPHHGHSGPHPLLKGWVEKGTMCRVHTGKGSVVWVEYLGCATRYEVARSLLFPGPKVVEEHWEDAPRGKKGKPKPKPQTDSQTVPKPSPTKPPTDPTNCPIVGPQNRAPRGMKDSLHVPAHVAMGHKCPL